MSKTLIVVLCIALLLVIIVIIAILRKRHIRRKAQRSSSVRRVQMPNHILLPIVIEEVEKQHTATINLRGYSMRPFLENDRDKALLKKMDKVEVGDAVLAEISEKHYVLHRIIAIDGDHVTLRGDGNMGTEHCKITDIKATAIGFYRKGRITLDSTSGKKWKIYSWWWMRLFPIRRYLLFAYRCWRKLFC